MYIHGLTDRTPLKYVMTFPYGYHVKSLKQENVIIRKSVQDLYELGLTIGISPCGNPIRLYVIMDIFSRHIVGWMIAHRENGALAKRLIRETVEKQEIVPGQLFIHADRGSSMTSKA